MLRLNRSISTEQSRQRSTYPSFTSVVASVFILSLFSFDVLFLMISSIVLLSRPRTPLRIVVKLSGVVASIGFGPNMASCEHEVNLVFFKQQIVYEESLSRVEQEFWVVILHLSKKPHRMLNRQIQCVSPVGFANLTTVPTFCLSQPSFARIRTH